MASENPTKFRYVPSTLPLESAGLYTGPSRVLIGPSAEEIEAQIQMDADMRNNRTWGTVWDEISAVSRQSYVNQLLQRTAASTDFKYDKESSWLDVLGNGLVGSLLDTESQEYAEMAKTGEYGLTDEQWADVSKDIPEHLHWRFRNAQTFSQAIAIANNIRSELISEPAFKSMSYTSGLQQFGTGLVGSLLSPDTAVFMLPGLGQAVGITGKAVSAERFIGQVARASTLGIGAKARLLGIRVGEALTPEMQKITARGVIGSSLINATDIGLKMVAIEQLKHFTSQDADQTTDPLSSFMHGVQLHYGFALANFGLRTGAFAAKQVAGRTKFIDRIVSKRDAAQIMNPIALGEGTRTNPASYLDIEAKGRGLFVVTPKTAFADEPFMLSVLKTNVANLAKKRHVTITHAEDNTYHISMRPYKDFEERKVVINRQEEVVQEPTTEVTTVADAESSPVVRAQEGTVAIPETLVETQNKTPTPVAEVTRAVESAPVTDITLAQVQAKEQAVFGAEGREQRRQQRLKQREFAQARKAEAQPPTERLQARSQAQTDTGALQDARLIEPDVAREELQPTISTATKVEAREVSPTVVEETPVVRAHEPIKTTDKELIPEGVKDEVERDVASPQAQTDAMLFRRDITVAQAVEEGLVKQETIASIRKKGLSEYAIVKEAIKKEQNEVIGELNAEKASIRNDPALTEQDKINQIAIIERDQKTLQAHIDAESGLIPLGDGNGIPKIPDWTREGLIYGDRYPLIVELTELLAREDISPTTRAHATEALKQARKYLTNLLPITEEKQAQIEGMADPGYNVNATAIVAEQILNKTLAGLVVDMKDTAMVMEKQGLMERPVYIRDTFYVDGKIIEDELQFKSNSNSKNLLLSIYSEVRKINDEFPLVIEKSRETKSDLDNIRDTAVVAEAMIPELAENAAAALSKPVNRDIPQTIAVTDTATGEVTPVTLHIGKKGQQSALAIGKAIPEARKEKFDVYDQIPSYGGKYIQIKGKTKARKNISTDPKYLIKENTSDFPIFVEEGSVYFPANTRALARAEEFLAGAEQKLAVRYVTKAEHKKLQTVSETRGGSPPELPKRINKESVAEYANSLQFDVKNKRANLWQSHFSILPNLSKEMLTADAQKAIATLNGQFDSPQSVYFVKAYRGAMNRIEQAITEQKPLKLNNSSEGHLAKFLLVAERENPNAIVDFMNELAQIGKETTLNKKKDISTLAQEFPDRMLMKDIC